MYTGSLITITHSLQFFLNIDTSDLCSGVQLETRLIRIRYRISCAR